MESVNCATIMSLKEPATAMNSNTATSPTVIKAAVSRVRRL
jgi:hypothetical protein